ncbi:hypothetical protein [Aequorivita sp. CIP111184]|uniref:hypothetical protein n=1 Tax=Aequorivita sp. CIP111184 TaxID=2211356 RepID=UPI000DBC1D4C|nr:hypothetical protein [Aequorivita sp. CIP111184]SRX54805.1 hypothetical protein AEQU1_01823 [Aequorivita sp. CIP111184]
MKLLPNEEQLLISKNKKMILTNHRVQMVESEWGQSSSITIFLEDISSIETKFKNDIWLLILAPLIILSGFFLGDFYIGEIATLAGITLGVLCLGIWWATRKRLISISSNGGSQLNFAPRGMDIDKINDLVQAILIAKQARVDQLHKV